MDRLDIELNYCKFYLIMYLRALNKNKYLKTHLTIFLKLDLIFPLYQLFCSNFSLLYF